LSKLNFEANDIEALPNDLQNLTNLFELNVKAKIWVNKLSDIFRAVDVLTKLPNLKSLHVDLDQEEQVDYVIKGLPELEFLNGLAVDRDMEAEEEEEEEEEPVVTGMKDAYDSINQPQTPE